MLGGFSIDVWKVLLFDFFSLNFPIFILYSSIQRKENSKVITFPLPSQPRINTNHHAYIIIYYPHLPLPIYYRGDHHISGVPFNEFPSPKFDQ